MTMLILPEWGKIVNVFSPLDVDTAVQGGNYNFVNIRNYQAGGFLLRIGAHSGDAVGFTIQQAKNVEGNSKKALTFTKYFRNKTNASPQEESDMWVEETAVSNTFDVLAQNQYFIPVRPGMLDVSNNFDSIRGELEAGSAATLASLSLLLWGGPKAIAGNVDQIPSTAVNRMPN